MHQTPALANTARGLAWEASRVGQGATWSGCELVRVRGCELTNRVRVDSGASWYWGELTRKRRPDTVQSRPDGVYRCGPPLMSAAHTSPTLSLTSQIELVKWDPGFTDFQRKFYLF